MNWCLRGPGCLKYWQKDEESEEECEEGTWQQEESKKYKILKSKVEKMR